MPGYGLLQPADHGQVPGLHPRNHLYIRRVAQKDARRQGGARRTVTLQPGGGFLQV